MLMKSFSQLLWRIITLTCEERVLWKTYLVTIKGNV